LGSFFRFLALQHRPRGRGNQKNGGRFEAEIGYWLIHKVKTKKKKGRRIFIPVETF
jgi:hypothetical protein